MGNDKMTIVVLLKVCYASSIAFLPPDEVVGISDPLHIRFRTT